MDRSTRHTIIRELLHAGPVAGQELLRDALASRGVSVTQATLSRDLKQLGAIRTAQGYELPQYTEQYTNGSVNDSANGFVNSSSNGANTTAAAALAETQLADSLARLMTSAAPAASITVVKTAPGHAPALAIALDQAPPAEAVGTIAGDDTIFIACHSNAAAKTLCATLSDLANSSTTTATRTA